MTEESEELLSDFPETELHLHHMMRPLFMSEGGESDVERDDESDFGSDIAEIDASEMALPPCLCSPRMSETPFLLSSTGALPKGLSHPLLSWYPAASDDTSKGKGVDRGKYGEDGLSQHERRMARYRPRGMPSFPTHSSFSEARLLGNATPDDEIWIDTCGDENEDHDEDVMKRVMARCNSKASAGLSSRPRELVLLSEQESLSFTSGSMPSLRGTIGKRKEVERANDKKEAHDMLSRYSRITARSSYLDPGFLGHPLVGFGGAPVGFVSYRRSPSTCLHCVPANHRYRLPGRSKICQAAEASGSGMHHEDLPSSMGCA